jgi:hypothetical protein
LLPWLAIGILGKEGKTSEKTGGKLSENDSTQLEQIEPCNQKNLTEVASVMHRTSQE